MSRSHHTTRRHLKEAKRSDFSDAKRKSAEVERLEGRLKAKRRTKALARYHRRTREIAPATPVETIAIAVTCDHPFAHFPASPEDLRAVLRLLPPGIADGLRAVELGLGEAAQKPPEGPLETELERDPFLGRGGYESLPRVYRGRCLGRYATGPAKIEVYAYVYPPNLPGRRMWEFYLRLHMLMTFVHEVAHHFDAAARAARGRWGIEPGDKAEHFAEAAQHRWIADVLVPYLCKTYPRDWATLRAWMREHLGAELPPALLAGDVRVTSKDGAVFVNAAFFNTAEAFEYLARSVAGGAEPTRARLLFARVLHYSGAYEPAHRIIDAVLARDRRNVEALALRGDILVHECRYDGALAAARRALALDRDDEDAMEVLADACEGLGQWARLLRAAEALATKWTEPREARWALLYRARARVELGRFDAARQDIEALEQGPGKLFRRRIRQLRKRLSERMAERSRP